MRLAVRLLVAAGVVAATLSVDASSVTAVVSHRTLVHSATVDGEPERPGFSIDFVAVMWEGHHGEATVRFLKQRRWSSWEPLPEDGIEEEGRFASALMPAGDADAYQLRVPSAARRPRAVALNTTDGPGIVVGHLPSDAARAATSVVS